MIFRRLQLQTAIRAARRCAVCSAARRSARLRLTRWREQKKATVKLEERLAAGIRRCREAGDEKQAVSH